MVTRTRRGTTDLGDSTWHGLCQDFMYSTQPCSKVWTIAKGNLRKDMASCLAMHSFRRYAAQAPLRRSFAFFAASVVLFLPGSNFLQRNVIHRKILFPLTYYFIHVIFRQWTFCIPVQPSCASGGCDRLRSEDLLTPLVLLALLILLGCFTFCGP